MRTLYKLQQIGKKDFSRMKGSVTLEAAVVLPLFLLAVSHLIFWISFLDQERSLVAEINAKSRKLAVESFVLGAEDDEPIEISKGAYLRGEYFLRTSIARPFTGRYYDTAGMDADEYKLAFITKNGEVYHRSLICSHIKISVKEVTQGVSALRNQSGEKYKPCEFCVKKKDGQKYFITKHGNRYHYDRTCKGIKRSIRLINLKLAKELGFGACKKCGGYRD